MDLNFIADPNSIPRPRDQVAIQSLKLTPYPDGQRIRVEIEITPFLPMDRPNLELLVHKDNGAEVASISVVESLNNRVSLTVHLRQSGAPDGVYSFRADLSYEGSNVQHSLETTVTIPDDIPKDREESDA